MFFYFLKGQLQSKACSPEVPKLCNLDDNKAKITKSTWLCSTYTWVNFICDLKKEKKIDLLLGVEEGEKKGFLASILSPVILIFIGLWEASVFLEHFI